jgi:beta-mannosidase
MKSRLLDSDWDFTVIGENVYGIPQTPIRTGIPATVYSILTAKGLMPDPFYRDNELSATRLMENDFRFEKNFTIERDEAKQESLRLVFEGIDTAGDVSLDGQHLGYVEDMNRRWVFDITELVKAALKADPDHVFTLVVFLHSPTRIIRERQEKTYTGGSTDSMAGFPQLRKAACMFGWDWGPRLPDAGLFRDVYLESGKQAYLEDVRISQKHSVSGHGVHGDVVSAVEMLVQADVRVDVHTPEERPDACQTFTLTLTVTDPDGQEAARCVRSVQADRCDGLVFMASGGLVVMIQSPQLWWPNGYGKQPLYTVRVSLSDKSGEIDVWEKRTGLRTIRVDQSPADDRPYRKHLNDRQCADEGEGRNFAFVINGLPLFAMGADYIPEDSILVRQSPRRTRMLLESAAKSHMNCVRVWGGGYFPDDAFYDACDELGLLVWQDFLFACASYELTDEMEENVRAELTDNVRRLRHHACIALWCGNNEIEEEIEAGDWHSSPKQHYDYIRLYETLMPRLMKQLDPDRFYWPSSPSSGGNFSRTHAENEGDIHYWGVWHGEEPFTAYRDHHFRFLSEFGFQSFPCMATVKSFTLPQDRNCFSRVMEMHQRNAAANGKVLSYISRTYRYPKDFTQLLYVSQLLQAEAIRYGVEHFRRFRGLCMGTVVWQLDDIWPVASWAGIDYFGRWKALQYAEKRMFAPLLLSLEESGEINQKPNVNSQQRAIRFCAVPCLTNETDTPVHGYLTWELRLPDSHVIASGKAADVTAAAYASTWLPELDFTDRIRQNAPEAGPLFPDGLVSPMDAHLCMHFFADDGRVSEATALFCAPKHYHLADPKLTLALSPDGRHIRVRAESFAKGVAISSEDGNLQLSDNFFDMEAGERTLEILPPAAWCAARQPEGPFRVQSLYDSYEHEGVE